MFGVVSPVKVDIFHLWKPVFSRKQEKDMSVALLTKHKKRPSQRLNCFTPLHPPNTLLPLGRNNVAALLDCCPSPLMIFFSPHFFFFTPLVWTDAAPLLKPLILWDCHKVQHNEVTLNYINGESPAQSFPSRKQHQTIRCCLKKTRLLSCFIYEWIMKEALHDRVHLYSSSRLFIAVNNEKWTFDCRK